MTVPNVTCEIDPSEGGYLEYEPAAPNDAHSSPVGVLALRIEITNANDIGAGAVQLEKVVVAFKGPPAVPERTIAVDDLVIAPKATVPWWFERVETVLLPLPAPVSAEVRLYFKGNATPWTTTMKLRAHRNPPPEGSYWFPGKPLDLSAGEFWTASSNTHGTSSSGNQLYAYDMGVAAGPPEQLVNRLKANPGGAPYDGTKNEHFRAFGKKIYAMAQGKVLHCLSGVPLNADPIDGTKAGAPWQQAPWDTTARQQTDAPGNGNHFVILHGTDEVVLYAHLQPDGLNTEIMHVDAIVEPGTYLGLLGNSGNATEPHIHIETAKGKSFPSFRPLPLLFHDCFAIDPSELKAPSIDGPWTRVSSQGPPIGPKNNFIWPAGRLPQWNGWQDLGPGLTSAPAVTSWGRHRLDVFAAGADHNLMHRSWDGSAWKDWQTLGGTFKGAPAAVSWGPDRIDVFVRGDDDHLGHRAWDGSAWSGWIDLGPVASEPGVASRAVNRLDVYAAQPDGQLAQKSWDGTKWGAWHKIGGVFKGAPAAVSRGSNRIDLFVRGTDDHLGHTAFDGSTWSNWSNLGGTLTSGPAVASSAVDRLDVFAAGADGQLSFKRWTGSSWLHWDRIGDTLAGAPCAVGRGPHSLDVFACGHDGHLAHLWWP